MIKARDYVFGLEAALGTLCALSQPGLRICPFCPTPTHYIHWEHNDTPLCGPASGRAVPQPPLYASSALDPLDKPGEHVEGWGSGRAHLKS